MRRRDFIAGLGSVAASVAIARRGGAQPADHVYRIGFLSEPPRVTYGALFEGLRELGLVEGKQFQIVGRGLGVTADQFSPIAAELAVANVDLVICAGNIALRAAQQATKTIPILGGTDDMVGSGLVASMSRPEGNTTGFSILAAELDGKRREILNELLPDARRVAFLVDPGQTSPQQLAALESAARLRGVDISVHRAGTRDEIAPAIDAAKASGAAALNVLATPLFFANSPILIERTIATSFPAMFQWPDMAERGGLVAYGPRLERIFREISARQIAKVLRGAKIADVPIELPTKFDLVINLKTAKALGLKVSETFLLRADKLIE